MTAGLATVAGSVCWSPTWGCSGPRTRGTWSRRASWPRQRDRDGEADGAQTACANRRRRARPAPHTVNAIGAAATARSTAAQLTSAALVAFVALIMADAARLGGDSRATRTFRSRDPGLPARAARLAARRALARHGDDRPGLGVKKTAGYRFQMRQREAGLTRARCDPELRVRGSRNFGSLAIRSSSAGWHPDGAATSRATPWSRGRSRASDRGDCRDRL